MTLRVLVADDQALVRAGFQVLVTTTPGMCVVGEAETGEQAVDMARRTMPDVVLMDVRMPGMNGIEATRAITGAAQTRGVQVIVVTTFDLDEYVYGALRAGASGFLLKDALPNELLNAIRVVATGDALLAPTVTRRLIAEFARRPEPLPKARREHATLDKVTAREREVLTLVGQGLSNAEIADRLHISPATAKAHVARLLSKLGARDRVQLVIRAYQAGLVLP